MSSAAGETSVRDLFGKKPMLFFVALIIWTLTNMDQALFGYAIPGILKEFNLPLEAAGVILTISFIVSAAFIAVSGLAADRYGRELVMAVLLVASALAVAAQGLAAGVISLTIFRSLGFGLSGGLSPTTNTIVFENSVARLRGVTVGMLQCGYPLGWFAASLFAAPLLANHGWRAICFVALLVVPLALPLVIVLRRYSGDVDVRTDRETPMPRPRLAVLFAPDLRRTSIACFILFFLFGGAYAGTAFFLPTFFTHERGYSAADAARVVGLSNGIAAIGYVGNALIGEFVATRRNVAAVWLFGGAAALVGLLWLSANPTQDVLWFAAMAILFFGSQSLIIVLVAELFPSPLRASALGVCCSAPLSLGFAVFPLVVPIVIASLGWAVGLSLIIVPTLLGTAAATLFLPNRQSGMVMDQTTSP